MATFRAAASMVLAAAVLLPGLVQAAPTAVEEERLCTPEDLLFCIEAFASSTLDCGEVVDRRVACTATTVWTIAGGSRLPASPPAEVVRVAEAILTVCSGPLCATSHYTQAPAQCRLGPATPWCTITTSLPISTGATMQPGQCADFALEAWMAGGLGLTPRALNDRITGGGPLIEVVVAPRATHQACA